MTDDIIPVIKRPTASDEAYSKGVTAARRHAETVSDILDSNRDWVELADDIEDLRAMAGYGYDEQEGFDVNRTIAIHDTYEPTGTLVPATRSKASDLFEDLFHEYKRGLRMGAGLNEMEER